MLREGPDGGAAGRGQWLIASAPTTPVPVNEGWDTAGSLQQGVDDLAAQRGGWDTMGGRDMGEALIRRHGLDGALEQINRIMADPASRRARQRNGDQGAWEAVQRYIQASVNRRGIGLAPDAPNAGPRRNEAIAAIGVTGAGERFSCRMTQRRMKIRTGGGSAGTPAGSGDGRVELRQRFVDSEGRAYDGACAIGIQRAVKFGFLLRS